MVEIMIQYFVIDIGGQAELVTIGASKKHQWARFNKLIAKLIFYDEGFVTHQMDPTIPIMELKV